MNLSLHNFYPSSKLIRNSVKLLIPHVYELHKIFPHPDSANSIYIGALQHFEKGIVSASNKLFVNKINLTRKED